MERKPISQLHTLVGPKFSQLGILSCDIGGVTYILGNLITQPRICSTWNEPRRDASSYTLPLKARGWGQEYRY